MLDAYFLGLDKGTKMDNLKTCSIGVNFGIGFASVKFNNIK